MQENIISRQPDSGSLTQLVEELQKSKADLEAKRHTENLLARLISLMRWRNDDTLERWTDRLLDELVLAVDGLQASLYMLEKPSASGNDDYLRLIGAYAFDKQKLRKDIPLGEGIIGQVAKSKRPAYFGAESNFETFSATGNTHVKPRALRVQPLIYNDILAGVLEISSIREIGQYETDFILQISENIAANLINIGSQVETRRLYLEMQIKSEALISQEEEMRQNVEELQATQEEMRRVQISLKEEADRTKVLLESMRDAVITIEKGRFLECNAAALRIFGCETKSEFLGKGWADFSATYQNSGRGTTEEIPDRLVQAMNDTGTSFEWKAKRKNGEEFDSEIYLSPFDYQGGTLLLMVVRDISEQKKNEARLLEQQQQMQIAQSIAKIGSWQLDMRSKNILWSDSMYQIYNVSPEAGPLEYEMLAQMTYFEDRDLFKQAYMDLVMYGSRSNIEYRIMPRGGDIKWVRTDGFAVRNDKGDIIKVYGLVQDITEQKERETEVLEKNNELASREAELQKALNRTTSLFNNSGDAILIIKDGTLEDVNPAGLRLFGYENKNQMLKHPIHSFCPENQYENVSSENFIARQFSALEQQSEVVFELKISRLNKEERDAEIRITKLLLDDHQYYQLIVRDVTDRKIQEIEIMRQKQMLDAIINCNTDNVMLVDRNFNIQLINDVFRNFYAELGMEVKPGMSIFELVSPDQKEAYQKRFERALNGEIYVEETFYTFRDVATYSEVSRFPVRDHLGNVFGIGIVSRDITTRKMQEAEILEKNNQLAAQEEEMRQNVEELQATQEQMRQAQVAIMEQQIKMQAIINCNTDSIMLVDKEFNVQMANETAQAYCRSMGFETIIGISIFNLSDPSEREINKKRFDRAFNGESFTEEFFYTFNNQSTHFELSMFPVKDAEDHIIGAGLVSRDITQRKLQETELTDKNNELMAQEEEMRQNLEELQATQEQMRKAQEALTEQQHKTQAIINCNSDIILMVDKNYTLQMANDAMRESTKSMGMELEIGMSIFNFLPPEEKEAYQLKYDRGLNGESYTEEIFYDFNGLKSYFEITVFPVKGTGGGIIGAGIVTKDITQRKLQEAELTDKNNELMAQEEEMRQNLEELQATQEQMRKAQEALMEQQQKIQAIINGSADNIFLLNEDSTVELANENFINWYKQFGVDIHVGDNIFDFVTPEEESGYRQVVQNALEGKSFTFENVYTFNGSSTHFEFDVFPAKDSSGKVMGVGFITRDITARKQYESDILEKNNQLAAQEEEMRQNMEELQATQDEMRRVQEALMESSELLKQQTITLNHIIDAVPQSIFWKDKEGKYLGYNKHFFITTGLPEDFIMIGKSDKDLPWAEVADMTWKEYQEVMDTGIPKLNVEEQILMEGAPEMWLKMSKVPLKDEQGDVFGVMGMFEDITALKVKSNQNNR